MKEIYIIRHAESISNAGEKTKNHHSVPLSEKGKGQAKQLAEELKITPDLIVVSPYSRTRETAEPFISKHPNVPVETWDVQEFTYLHPEIYKDTTVEERFERAIDYWTKASIHHKEEDSESFFDLTNRIISFLDKLKMRPEKTITVFSHGRFIHALKLHMEKMKELGKEELSENEINELKQFQANEIVERSSAKQKFPIDNVSVHRIEI